MEHRTAEVPVRPRPTVDGTGTGTAPADPDIGVRDETTGAADERDLRSTVWPSLAAADLPESEDPVDISLEIEDGETTLFEAAINAFHAGEFQRAESLFLEEAQRNLEDAPQRAAISYRQAALAAGEAGNIDAADHWMRLAGREYLRVTEDDRTPLPFIREAAVMAARCFVSVENLNVATKGLRRAQAIESVIRADDDLMAQPAADQVGPAVAPVPVPATPTVTAVPAHPSTEPTAVERRPTPPEAVEGQPNRYRMVERQPTMRQAAPAVVPPGEPASPRPVPDADIDAERSPGWFQRLRRARPDRHPA